MLVVAIGWLYLLPQFQGAGSPCAPPSARRRGSGPVIVGVVVLANVTSGGMRSITFVQAFQYWLKLTALLVPAAVLLVVWAGDAPPPTAGDRADWSVPLARGGAAGPVRHLLADHRDVPRHHGAAARGRALLHQPRRPGGPPYDAGGARRCSASSTCCRRSTARSAAIYAPELATSGRSDALVLELPRLMVAGLAGELLTGLVTAGAFAAFLSTSSGLAIAVAGVLSQDVTAPAVAAGRGRGVPARGGRRGDRARVVALAVPDLGVARAVGLAFAMAASTFCPLLLLGIWWRRLTDVGAIAGLVAGGLGSAVAIAWTLGVVTPTAGRTC